jgi:hypothetical protein
MASPLQVQRSLIDGDAGAIELALQQPENVRAVGVVAHPHPLFGGTMDNKVVTTLARAFSDAGAATWRFNFRGIGKTEGQHDEGAGETQDMLKVIAHARAQHPGLPLWLAGFSFGGAVTLAASEQTAPNEMILVAPSFQRLAQWRDGPAAATIDVVAENTLLIHGEKDETVALSDSFDWARPRNVAVAVVPGADHFFHQRLGVIRQIVGRWLPAPS